MNETARNQDKNVEANTIWQQSDDVKKRNSNGIPWNGSSGERLLIQSLDKKAS